MPAGELTNGDDCPGTESGACDITGEIVGGGGMGGRGGWLGKNL